jgi:predicted Co/Zn/Cd cation transporter (cation efflux family)
MQMDTSREQTLLKRSIIATLMVGAGCASFGLWMGSQAIVFDGIYSLVDMLMTLVVLAVSRLLSNEGSRRFQYGFWHLEPLVVVFNSAMLSLACAYAVINAITGLTHGGHELPFELGAGWAGLIGIISMSLAAYMQRGANSLSSELLRLDARSWFIGGALSIGLLIGFGGAAMMAGTNFAPWARYVDSAVLLTIALCLLPMPVMTVWHALQEVLMVAPNALDLHVRTLMDTVVAEHRFAGYTSYVTRTGRVEVVEINVVVPEDYPLSHIGDLDAVRQEIAERLGGQSSQYWLSIAFTGDLKWV